MDTKTGPSGTDTRGAFGDRHKIRALIKVIGMHIENTYIYAYNNASILGTDHANHTQY